MITTPRIVGSEELPTAVIHLVVPGKDMPKYMDPAIQEVLKAIAEQGLTPTGPMFSYHHRRPSDTFDFDLGFPIAKAIKPTGRVVNGKLPAEKVVRAVYQGPYERLGDAWGELQAWVREQELAESGRFWERYLTNPNDVKDDKDHRTELNWVIGE